MTCPAMVPESHRHTILIGTLTVVVDYRTGAVTALTGDAARDWTTRGSGRPGPCLVTASAPAWGTREVPACLPLIGAAPWRWRMGAVLALAMVLTARHLGRPTRRFARMYALTRPASRRPAATASQARYAVRAARWAARRTPVKTACLEESVTAALLLGFARCGAAWRHGIATDPVRLHAWIAGPDGRPVEEPADIGLYTSFNV